jgi:hypothetical protein
LIIAKEEVAEDMLSINTSMTVSLRPGNRPPASERTAPHRIDAA